MDVPQRIKIFFKRSKTKDTEGQSFISKKGSKLETLRVGSLIQTEKYLEVAAKMRGTNESYPQPPYHGQLHIGVTTRTGEVHRGRGRVGTRLRRNGGGRGTLSR